MSSYNNSSSFDSLLLQGLMGRLQLRPPYLNTNSYLSKSLEELLLDTNSINDEDDGTEDESEPANERTQLAREESRLEKEIIRVIHSGKIEILKPNSGQAVAIGEHHICVGFHQESNSDYRVWEWHGHIMLFDEENGYNPEYIYGNYFERLAVKPIKVVEEEKKKEEEEEKKEEEEKSGNLGLRELIDGGDSISGRILCRHLNAGSSR